MIMIDWKHQSYSLGMPTVKEKGPYLYYPESSFCTCSNFSCLRNNVVHVYVGHMLACTGL